jgi:hypothetical protein
VERRNAECKSKQPVALQHALANVYKLDKSVCAKHLAALDGCSVSYRDRSENARRSAAQKRQEQRHAANVPDDPTALQGPPDRVCHFDKLNSLARGIHIIILYVLLNATCMQHNKDYCK